MMMTHKEKLEYARARANGASIVGDITDAAHWEREVQFLSVVVERDELLMALKEIVTLVEQDIKDMGGCDHSVGICMCDMIRAVERARAVIAKAEAAS